MASWHDPRLRVLNTAIWWTQNSINRRTQALVQGQNCKHVFDSILWNQPTEKANLGIWWSLKLEQLDPICLPSPKWLIENKAIIVIDVRVIKSYPPVIREHEIPPWESSYLLHLSRSTRTRLLAFASCESSSRKTWLRRCVPSWNPRHGTGNSWLPVDLDLLLLVVLVFFLPSQIPFS